MKPKPERCKVMPIHFLKNPLLEVQLCVDTTCLGRVCSLLLLGIVIRADLKLNNRVQLVVSRAARRWYILSVLKKSRGSVGDMVTNYKVYIHSLLEFGSPV